MNEKEELMMLRDMLEHMPGGAFTYEAEGDQRFIYVSPSLYKLLGYEDEESFLKSVNYSFIEFVHPDDYEKIQQEIDDQISQSDIDFCEYRVKKADGTYIWMLDRGKIMRRPDGSRFFYVVVLDENAIMHKRLETAKKAKQDSLTGLLNHQAIVMEINALIQDHCEGVCMMLDIDDFKRINDNYGHIEGDRVIVTLSKALLAEFPNALVGRFGGDEFLLYFVGAKEEDHAEELGKKVVKIMNKIKINGSIPLCGSIGISLSRGGFFSVDEAVRKADEAMYSAKKSGKNQFAIK